MYAVHLPVKIPPAGSADGPPLPSEFHEFGGAPFDVLGLFRHIIANPDDLPRALEWLQTAFSSMGKSPGPLPKFPWEQ
jgi:hypothetical protein